MPDLIYDNCRCRVTWDIPPNSNWQNPLLSGTEKLTITATLYAPNGDYGIEDRIKSLAHLAEARETQFVWKGIGMHPGQNWGVKAGIRPSQCKIDGITYLATWKYDRDTHRVIETEDDREVEIELGLPDLTAMA